MKSIEERAYKFACKNDKPSSFFCDLKKSYKAGATEQRAIDDNHLRDVKKMVIDKACEWLKMYDITFTQTPSMLEDFKRAMEE